MRPSDTAFVSSERMLAERQIDFDIININALAEDLKAGPGTLASMRQPVSYGHHSVGEDSLPGGAGPSEGAGQGRRQSLFLGRTPSLIYTKNILDGRAATPDDFSFATVETSAQLPPTPTPPAAAPATPPGPLVVPAEIETALNKVIGIREVALDTPDAALKGDDAAAAGRQTSTCFSRGSASQLALGDAEGGGQNGGGVGPGDRDGFRPWLRRRRRAR